jgi:hypothetical protein
MLYQYCHNIHHRQNQTFDSSIQQPDLTKNAGFNKVICCFSVSANLIIDNTLRFRVEVQAQLISNGRL